MKNTFNLYSKLLSKSWGLILLILGISFAVNAQNQATKIQLLNTETQDAIAFAHFHYGEQKGISDENGFLELTYQAETILRISHIEYGNLNFSDQEVKNAFETKQFTIKNTYKINLQPVTVIGIKLESAESKMMQVDTQDKLSHDAASFLNQTPSISSIRKGGNYGLDPVMRGFKYEQLNIVIDGGQSSHAACPNRMDPPASQISLNQMDRVEILKGPHNLRFGNSFGGTINFISSKTAFTDNLTPLGRVSTSYESNGSIFRTEGVLGFSAKNYVLKVNGAFSKGDDYTDGEGVEIASGFERASFGANLALKLSENQRIDISATKNIAKDVEFASLPMDLRDDKTWLMNVKHSLDFDKEVLTSLKTTLFYSSVDHLMDNLLKPLKPRMLNASTPATTTVFGGRSEAKLNFKSSFAYLGMDYKKEEAEGTRYREILMGNMAGKTFEENAWQHGSIEKTGFFAEYHFGKNTYNFVFSGRLNINKATALDVTEEYMSQYPDYTVNQINPNVSFGAVKNFSKDVSLGLWLGRAQRSGGIAERYINYFTIGLDPYEMLGNPNLNPEINNQIDLNLTIDKENTKITANIFASYLQDYISSVIREDLKPKLPMMAAGVRQFINVDEAMMTGFEFSINQRLPLNMQTQFAIAYTKGQNITTDEALPEISPIDMRFKLLGSFANNKFFPELSLRVVGKQDRFASSYGETETPAFTVLDFSSSYHFNKTFHLSAGVQNLFDVAYYEHLNRSVRNASKRPIYAVGRNFYATLSINLMK